MYRVREPDEVIEEDDQVREERDADDRSAQCDLHDLREKRDPGEDARHDGELVDHVVMNEGFARSHFF